MRIICDAAVFLGYVLGVGLTGAIVGAILFGLYYWYALTHQVPPPGPDYFPMFLMWGMAQGGMFGFAIGAVVGFSRFVTYKQDHL